MITALEFRPSILIVKGFESLRCRRWAVTFSGGCAMSHFQSMNPSPLLDAPK
jgi:hypothetical protein